MRRPSSKRATQLYEAKRIIEAVNLSLDESEVKADQIVSGLGQLIQQNDAQLDLSSQTPVLTVIAIALGAARHLLRPASEPQHQPAAARARRAPPNASRPATSPTRVEI